MASAQLERFADSAVMKILGPAASTLALTFGMWGLNKVSDRLDRMEQLLNAQQAERLVMQRDLEGLKTTAAQRGEALSQMHDQVLKLQFDVQQLQQLQQHTRP